MGGMAVSTRAGEVYTYSTSLHQVRLRPTVSEAVRTQAPAGPQASEQFDDEASRMHYLCYSQSQRGADGSWEEVKGAPKLFHLFPFVAIVKRDAAGSQYLHNTIAAPSTVRLFDGMLRKRPHEADLSWEGGKRLAAGRRRTESQTEGGWRHKGDQQGWLQQERRRGFAPPQAGPPGLQMMPAGARHQSRVPRRRPPGSQDLRPVRPPPALTHPLNSLEEQRVELVNTQTNHRLRGANRPKRRDLADFLRRYPEYVLYTEQQQHRAAEPSEARGSEAEKSIQQQPVLRRMTDSQDLMATFVQDSIIKEARPSPPGMTDSQELVATFIGSVSPRRSPTEQPASPAATSGGKPPVNQRRALAAGPRRASGAPPPAIADPQMTNSQNLVSELALIADDEGGEEEGCEPIREVDLSDGGDGLETDVWKMGGNPLSQSMKYVPISRQQPGLSASPGPASALPQPHGGALVMAGADTTWSAWPAGEISPGGAAAQEPGPPMLKREEEDDNHAPQPAAAATAAAAASTVWCELPYTYAGPTASPPPVARENWEEKVSNW